MDTVTVPPNAPRLKVEEENALVSQVLEIIGGITLEELQTLDQPAERDVWSTEEEDDSVFYSDEDQTQQVVKVGTSHDIGAITSKQLVESEAAEEPVLQRGGDQGAEIFSNKENVELEKKETLQFILTGEEEAEEEVLQTAKSEQMHQLDITDPGEEHNLTPENLGSTDGETLQPNCSKAEMKTQPGQNMSEAANLQVRQEEEGLEAQTPNLEPFDLTHEESYTMLNVEAGVPKDMASPELVTSGDRQPDVAQGPDQDRGFHVPVGFHQGPSPGHSTLPLPKKSSRAASHQMAFDHLNSPKYSTVSYRKIRRGNTRQKIEEFEYMMLNL